MKPIVTSLSAILLTLSAAAQTPQIPNAGFESWGGNTNPPSTSLAIPNEPTGWYSNQSGSQVAQLGDQTCFKDANVKHSGSYSVRMESILKNLGVTTVIVNGNVTTGVINAPSINKAEGYIGTINTDAPSDIRRVAFNGRPDSLVGWYQYTQGSATERGKVRVILHNGNYFDPETPVNGNHPDSSANKVGDALFVTPLSNTAVWTRFSVPFSYVKSTAPGYIMVNMTSSNDQLTTVGGSKLWVDDLQVIYNGSNSINNVPEDRNIKVYSYNKTAYVDFLTRNNGSYMIEIFNQAGQKVASQKLGGGNINAIDMNAVQAGVYFYHLSGNSVEKSGKLVIE